MSEARRPLPAGYVGAIVSAFTDFEIAVALCSAFVIEAVVLVGMGMVNTAHIEEKRPEVKKEIPISVKPILDETKLLKLGGKEKEKYKLPDMWKKQPPVIKRYEAGSAPSPDAVDDPSAIPDAGVTDGEPPPPDAEVAKEVDELQADASDPDAEATVEGEGHADGVEGGTETDPLKARAISGYNLKLLGWFNARFTPPSSGAPCEELKQLRAAVSVNIGGDRSVSSYSIVSPSGNATFDAQVRATMDGTIGQPLPPPPKNYPDILGTNFGFSFSGSRAQCE